jgi:subfamily B ATP-binding cassette protein MsbA
VNRYRRILGYVRPYRKRFFFAFINMIGLSAATSAAAVIVKPIMDYIFINKDVTWLKMMPLMILIIYLVKGLTNFIQHYQMKYIGQALVRDMRDELYDHLIGMPLTFFHKRSTGSLMSRILNDVTLIQNALTTALAHIIKEPVIILGLIAVLLYRNWFLALIALVVFPAAVYPLTRFGKTMRKVTRKSQAKISLVTTLLHETISGIKIVKAFGMEDFEKDRFHEENERLFRLYLKSRRVEALSTPVMDVMGAFGLAAVVIVGGQQVISGNMTAGEFFSFLAAMILLYEPLKKLTKVNNATQEGLAAAERIFEIIDHKSDIVEKPGAEVLERASGRVVFEGVTFGYGNQEVIRGIDLAVEPGEAVAFVGSSGVGKTTLLSLIPRFYDVTGGRITIDGRDIRDVTIASLRHQIAIVTQETVLFNDTVRNNIAYGRPDISEEEIREAARAAYADGFIDALPSGYETIIGEQGVTLSGGQRQRLCIARAILKDAPILILDEATSSLDSESEMLVQKALDNLMSNRTTFVIAHRLGTVVNADRIVVLEGGVVSRVGRHQELLEESEIYKKLYHLQFREVRQAP